MQITDVAAVFPVIFLGELPDKTMFASLALASRGRPLAVWVGASVAFVVHVAIAVTVGGLLVAVVPHRALQLAVAAGFLAGAGWSWHSRGGDDHRQQVPAPPPS
ncbi:MAG TPA: TMEM165/GDT1 family protein, partial [Acidimicrobiales bacterium]|nr:TMEM165/GDT1 family protein [Acidimicrobiales bacterium]